MALTKAASLLSASNFALARAQTLARTQTVSVQALDKAKFDAESNEAALVSAKAQVAVWQGVSKSLAARLIDPSSSPPMQDPVCCVQIRAPATGRVLKINQESESVIQLPWGSTSSESTSRSILLTGQNPGQRLVTTTG